MTEVERVETAMRVQSGPSGTGGAYVRFFVGGESFEIMLDYDLDEHQVMQWRRSSTEHRERLEGGGDIAWENGRIMAAGPRARRFYEVMIEFGLSFGSIEFELRALTGYEEGP